MSEEVLTDKVKLYLGDVSLTQLESLVKGIYPESKKVFRGLRFHTYDVPLIKLGAHLRSELSEPLGAPVPLRESGGFPELAQSGR